MAFNAWIEALVRDFESKPQQRFVQLYNTASYGCSYLPEQRARAQVVIAGGSLAPDVFSRLTQEGFRRSGLFVYRPRCDLCQACVPVRLRVAAFMPNRTQRRVWRRLSGLSVSRMPLVDNAEHYALYRQYQAVRHPGGGMDGDGPQQYRDFLLKTPVNSEMIEFRAQGVLKMVSVVDVLSDGWSAVYTFFDPLDIRLSYGVYNVLWQVNALKRAAAFLLIPGILDTGMS